MENAINVESFRRLKGKGERGLQGVATVVCGGATIYDVPLFFGPDFGDEDGESKYSIGKVTRTYKDKDGNERRQLVCKFTMGAKSLILAELERGGEL